LLLPQLPLCPHSPLFLVAMTLPLVLGGAGPRRGSMPLPIKHQLIRAPAVDELDSPPSSPEMGGGGPSPAGGRGPYKVMLLGESGVGKTTLAAIFGGTQGGSHPILPNFLSPLEDTYERRICVDEEDVTLILYDIWDQGEPGGWMQESCLQTGDAFLVVFSVTDRRSFTRLPATLLRLRAGSPRPDPPVILVGNKSDLVRSREVSLEAFQIVQRPLCALTPLLPAGGASSRAFGVALRRGGGFV
uniref:RRAD and GEM like GTPase 2 n=1 Tax=Sphenodon punctatus TaxID=8508 RepID=A0A8D0G6J4_SPHPU